MPVLVQQLPCHVVKRLAPEFVQPHEAELVPELQ